MDTWLWIVGLIAVILGYCLVFMLGRWISQERLTGMIGLMFIVYPIIALAWLALEESCRLPALHLGFGWPSIAAMTASVPASYALGRMPGFNTVGKLVLQFLVGFAIPFFITAMWIDTDGGMTPGRDVIVGVRYLPALFTGWLGLLVAFRPERCVLQTMCAIVTAIVLLENLANLL